MYPTTDTARGQQAAAFAEKWNTDDAVALLQEPLTLEERVLLACIQLRNEDATAALTTLGTMEGTALKGTADIEALRCTAQALKGGAGEQLQDALLSSLSTAVLACCVDVLEGSPPKLSIAVSRPLFLQLARHAYHLAMNEPPEQSQLETQKTLFIALQAAQLWDEAEEHALAIFQHAGKPWQLMELARTVGSEDPLLATAMLERRVSDPENAHVALVSVLAEMYFLNHDVESGFTLLQGAKVQSTEQAFEALKAWIVLDQAADDQHSLEEYLNASAALVEYLPLATVLSQAARLFSEGEKDVALQLALEILNDSRLGEIMTEGEPETWVRVELERSLPQGKASWFLHLPVPFWRDFLDHLADDTGIPDPVQGQALLLRALLLYAQLEDFSLTPQVQSNFTRAEALIGVTLCSAHFVTSGKTRLEVMTRRLEAIPEGTPPGSLWYAYSNGLYDCTETNTAQEATGLHQLITAPHPAIAPEMQERVREHFRRAGWWPEPLKTFELHALVVEAVQLLLLDTPDDTALLFGTAFAAMKIKTREADELAERLYRRLIELKPDHDAAHNNLAVTLERRGAVTESHVHFLRAVQLDPDNQLYRRNLESSWKKQPRLEYRPNAQTTKALQDTTRMYWEREGDTWKYTVKELTALSGLKAASQLGGGVALDPSSPCQACGEYIRAYASRTDYAERDVLPRPAPYFCAKCTAVRKAEAEAARTALMNERALVIQHRFAHAPGFDPAALSLRDTVALVALVRSAGSQDLRSVHPLADREWGPLRKDAPLAASPSDAEELIYDLETRGLIVPHPGTPVSAFEFNADNTDVSSMVMKNVHWRLNAGGPEGFAEVYAQLQAQLRRSVDEWPQGWQDDLMFYARDLLTQEAITDLILKLQERHLPFEPGEKTTAVFHALLEHFSLSMLWNLNWQAASSALNFKVTKGVNARHAANAAITTLERRGEKHQAEGTSPKINRRDWNSAVPAVSQVLFVSTLGLSDPPYADLLLRDLHLRSTGSGPATPKAEAS